VAKNCALPIIGNGDLHTPHAILAKKQTTHCQALMVARGSIRNPFIFLESELFADEEDSFTATDYLEVLHVFAGYINDHFHQDQIKTIQLKKHAAWFAQGFPFVAQFRQKVFTAESFDHLLKLCDEFFLSIKSEFQKIDHAQNFMSSGHG
jgi:tRNA-dihydrouridine synthase